MWTVLCINIINLLYAGGLQELKYNAGTRKLTIRLCCAHLVVNRISRTSKQVEVEYTPCRESRGIRFNNIFLFSNKGPYDKSFLCTVLNEFRKNILRSFLNNLI